MIRHYTRRRLIAALASVGLFISIFFGSAQAFDPDRCDHERFQHYPQCQDATPTPEPEPTPTPRFGR